MAQPLKAAESEADRTATISRQMKVPARYVFESHSRAEHIQRWFGPVGYPVTTCEYDFRVGGKWRMVMTGPDGKEGPPFGGAFLDIVPGRRIVYTNGFLEGAGDLHLKYGNRSMVMTTTFDDSDGGTLVTVSILFADAAMKEEYMAMRMLDGLSSGLDQQEAVAAELAARG